MLLKHKIAMNKGNYAFIVIVLAFFLCGASKITLVDIETAIIEEDYPGAQKLVQTFIDYEPSKDKLDQALYYLGLSQLRQDHYKDARETFNLLISSFPNKQLYTKAYLGVIDSLYLEGEFTSGLKIAEELYEKSSDSELLSLIYLKLARGNMKLTNWQKARGYLNKIIREFPDSFVSHLSKQLLSEKQYFAVQVGAFLERWRADKLSQELGDIGEYAYIVETIDRTGRKFYRVRVGKLTSLNEAEKMKSKLAQLGYPTRIYP